MNIKVKQPLINFKRSQERNNVFASYLMQSALTNPDFYRKYFNDCINGISIKKAIESIDDQLTNNPEPEKRSFWKI